MALGDLGATATASGPNATVLSGASPFVPAVPGGATNVGDVALTTIPADLGSRLPALCDSCTMDVDLPFPITVFGQSHSTMTVGGSGGVTLGSPSSFAEFDLLSGLQQDASDSASGVYVNPMPDRVVLTWFRLLSPPKTKQNTVQLTLFADGRIQYGYPNIGGLGFTFVAVRSPNVISSSAGELHGAARHDRSRPDHQSGLLIARVIHFGR
jgi:hypothetical protein